MIAAPISGDRSRFVISSVTIPKKPSSKKTIRDKNNFAWRSRHDTTSHRIASPAGHDIARHGKLAFQAYVLNMRMTWHAGDMASVASKRCGMARLASG